MHVLSELNPVWGIIVGVAGFVAYVYSTFATISYVDQKHKEIDEKLDDHNEAIADALKEIKVSVQNTEAKVWELAKK